MITARGWTLLIGAGVLCLAGRLLGAVDLFVLGTGAAALVALATLVARLPGPRLDVRRELHPPRVYAGTESRVELIVRNAGSRRTPVFGLRVKKKHSGGDTDPTEEHNVKESDDATRRHGRGILW